MTWAALILKIIDLLWPILREWIERLLADVEQALDGDPAIVDPPAAVARVFAAARSRTSMFRFWRHRVLDRCERIAMRHAGELAQAARFGESAPQLTAEEREELKALL